MSVPASPCYNTLKRRLSKVLPLCGDRVQQPEIRVFLPFLRSGSVNPHTVNTLFLAARIWIQMLNERNMTAKLNSRTALNKALSVIFYFWGSSFIRRLNLFGTQKSLANRRTFGQLRDGSSITSRGLQKTDSISTCPRINNWLTSRAVQVACCACTHSIGMRETPLDASPCCLQLTANLFSNLNSILQQISALKSLDQLQRLYSV